MVKRAAETASEIEGIAQLKQRMDILIALALCQLEHRTEPSEVIAVLSRFDIEPREIAAIMGMTPNAVRVARHRLRRGAPRAQGSLRRSSREVA